ncbi:MAG TPA: acyl-CoA dehydratase activase-related protein, partial [Deltaproteobacteria bacterium]|nr:acyl-CoA dehydratase activase-related protein [Deltaproteobacteria bacterium]
TVVKTGNETVSWGYLCGREQGSGTKAGKGNPAMRLRQDLLARFGRRHESRERTVRVPALGLYDEFIPLFTEMGTELNIPIEVCCPTKDEIARELTLLGSGDFCYPIKVAIACTNITARKFPEDPVLLPFLIQEEKDREITPRSLYCPFITSLPSLYKHCPDSERIYTPILDLSEKPSRQAGWIGEFFEKAGFPGISRSRIEKAYKKGIEKLYEYRRMLTAQGKSLLEGFPKDRPVIVLLGRPYNLYHKILNLGIPELIESLGYAVVPMDIIPDEVGNTQIMEHFPDLFWHSGQRILRKALTIKSKPNMFPLMLSNFSCGPDSFILSYFEEVSRSKPYLILELDEHGSATGYQTRIEAFCDMIEQYRARAVEPSSTGKGLIHLELEDIRGTSRIWISQIHPYIPQLWSAVLSHHGYDAVPTGEVTSEECALGRSFCRGSECLPAAVTIGKFISCVSKNGNGSDRPLDLLFMPRAEGPCRFGQYATLQSRIIERAGLKHAGIFSSVTSEDGYTFLTPAMELQIWRATCLGDMLFKLRCRTVPYHPNPLKAQELFDEALREICSRLSEGRDWKETVHSLTSELKRSLGRTKPRKPLVGVVGEIFVRMNTFSNQRIIETIEAGGGEAWLSPMTEWLYYVWEDVSRKSGFLSSIKTSIKSRFLHLVEKNINALFSPLLDDRREPLLSEVISRGEYFMPMEFEGEAILTIGRAKLFAEQGADLVV